MKYQRWVAAPDNHGDMADPGALKAFWEFLEFWKPTIRVHLGDCFDLRCLRRKASPEEQRETTGLDIESGCAFLRKLKPTHWLRGNHDERLYDAMKSDDGKLSDFAGFVAEEVNEATKGCEIFPYDKRKGVLKLGHLKFVHGYHAGLTAARIAAQVYGSVVMGHVHTIEQYSIPGLERRIGRCCGCLCKLDQDYNRAGQHVETSPRMGIWPAASKRGLSVLAGRKGC